MSFYNCNYLFVEVLLKKLELSINVGGTDAVRAVGKCYRHLERVCFSETVVADDECDPFYNMTEGVCKTEFESNLKECWTDTVFISDRNSNDEIFNFYSFLFLAAFHQA